MRRFHLSASIVHLVTSRQLSFEHHYMKTHLKDNEKDKEFDDVIKYMLF